MAGTSLTGWPRLCAAVVNSVRGLAATWRHEEAFRLELGLLALALPLSLVVGESAAERLLLVGVVVLVLVAELLNSAVESVVDRVGLEQHELSGRAKDQGSAAVFVMDLLALVTWLVIWIW